MPIATSAYTVLRLHASKKQSPEVSFSDFSAYINKYAQRYAEEQPELSVFITGTHDAVNTAIDELTEQKKIIVRNEKETKLIIVTSYYRDLMIIKYKEISSNAAITFPVRADMPRGFPDEMLVNKEATELLYDFFDKKPRPENISENVIYALVFKKDLISILVPDGLSPELLLELSISKIRRIMNKSGQYDYYLKKMISANSGRDVSAKAFFTQFVNQTSMTIHSMKQGGESYYFWNQLLTFIRNDYEKIQDKMQDDTALLQAINVTEIAAAYYKSKSQAALQKETALKNLDLAFEKPPFYYDYDSITRFTDSRGIPLLGQFEAEDLNEYIKKSTTAADNNKLPALLTFKVENSGRYFVFKDKVIPLVLKLCSDSRDKLRTKIIKDWFDRLKNFKTEPAMADQVAFEKKIENLINADIPILYSLLMSSFLPVVYQEAKDAQDKAATYKLFSPTNTLLPFSDLLILSRTTMLTDAKILLPVWYTIPIISFFFALFSYKKAADAAKNKKKEKEAGSVILSEKKQFPQNKKNQRDAYKSAAIAIERELVPPSSSLDIELSLCLNEWNRILDKQSKKNLAEDVNSLVRDYMRQILRKLGPSNFTILRVKNLAETLVENPVLQKIKEKEALFRYLQLYILQIVKTS